MKNPSFTFAICFAVWVSACAAFIGPATTPTEDFYFDCDDAGLRCDRRYEVCSRTKPVACRFVGRDGVSRDAGSE